MRISARREITCGSAALWESMGYIRAAQVKPSSRFLIKGSVMTRIVPVIPILSRLLLLHLLDLLRCGPLAGLVHARLGHPWAGSWASAITWRTHGWSLRGHPTAWKHSWPLIETRRESVSKDCIRRAIQKSVTHKSIPAVTLFHPYPTY